MKWEDMNDGGLVLLIVSVVTFWVLVANGCVL